MLEKYDQYKRLLAIIIIAFLLGGASYSNAPAYPVVNNTNLGSIDHSNGTDERLPDHIYWANSTPILVYGFWHTISNNDVDANISINKVVVQDTNLRLPGVVDDHFSMTVIIPKGANYSFSNNSAVHHYEWREYKFEKSWQ